MEKNKTKICAFLDQYFRDPKLQDDDDMFAGGQLNSLLAMQLVLFLENEFGMQLGDDDLVLDNFRSINNLADLIARKQGVFEA